MKKTVLGLLAGLLLLAGCQNSPSSHQTRAPWIKSTPSASVVATTSASSTGPKTSFTKGDWVAGTDIKPGRYTTTASFSTGTCVLTIKSTQNKFIAKFTIAAGDSIRGVEIRQGQHVNVTGGCQWLWYEPNK